MDLDDVPASPFLKKRAKGIRPSGSTSSLRSLAANGSPSTSSLSFNADDDEEGGNVVIQRPKVKKTTAGRVLDREGAPKAKSRLSFGGGDEEEEEDSSFSIKRSTESPRKLLRPSSSSASLRTDGVPQSLDQASISTPATPIKSIYSREYLNQLKATTLSTPPPTRGEYDELTQSKFGSRIDDESVEIPTTAAIADAKERRERMRAEGGGTGSDAFISLEVGMVRKGGESRLVREADEIGDGDEDMADFTGVNESVPLGKKANKEAAKRLRSGMIDMIQDAEEEEEDEEAMEWEQAQIRRSEPRRTVETMSPSKRPYRAAAIPSTATLPSLTGVTARLATALSTLKVSHTIDAAALEHFAHERAELAAQEKELREEVTKIEEKSRWFGDFKVFIEEVAAFLDEKVPLLEKIEGENLSIQRERSDIVSRRRYVDDSDDVSLFTGTSVPTLYSPVPLSPPRPMDAVDEYGRTVQDPSDPRSSLRIARRSTREQRLAVRPNQDEEESAWTDDELEPSDSADLSDALRSLRESLEGLFADVKADDFRDPNLGIRAKFEQWREKFGDEYGNAYGGLAMVGVWEFWARVEMALWNPFEIEQMAKTAPGLDSYKWHKDLGSYGHMDDAGDGEEDEASAVVNALVASVVAPRLEKLARESFDPMSRRQTTRALALLEEVEYSVERSSPKFVSLVEAFLGRIQLAVTQSQSLVAPHLASIALPSNAFDPSTFIARTRFVRRQHKLLQNSLRWRRYAKSVKLPVGDGIAAGGTLEELLVRELVAKVVLPVVEAGWGTGGEEVARQILALLPPDNVPPALIRRLEGQR